MASKIECTAVNELVDLVQRRPLDRDSGEDLLFSAPREANLRRTAAGTQPPPMGTPRPIGLFAVELSIEPTEARATMPKISVRKPVFEATPRDDLETTQVPRYSSRLSELTAELPILARKFAIPAGILVMVGIGVGAAISISRHHTTAPATKP